MKRRQCTPPAPVDESYDFGQWRLTTRKSHILPSLCAKGSCQELACKVCEYRRGLTLPHLPDMVFPDNVLRLVRRDDGVGIEFNALDALKRVDDKGEPVKVAAAQAWAEARRADAEAGHATVSHPFDWTFTSDYSGTLLAGLASTATDLRIDMDKLRRREAILFFDEVHLYEDELADHGCASLSIKVRVMASGCFVLLRFYLRVDDVLIRINDTRLYHETGAGHLLREYTSRQARCDQLTVPRVFWGDPNEIAQHLPVVHATYEKIDLP